MRFIRGGLSHGPTSDNFQPVPPTVTLTMTITLAPPGCRLGPVWRLGELPGSTSVWVVANILRPSHLVDTFLFTLFVTVQSARWHRNPFFPGNWVWRVILGASAWVLQPAMLLLPLLGPGTVVVISHAYHVFIRPNHQGRNLFQWCQSLPVKLSYTGIFESLSCL